MFVTDDMMHDAMVVLNDRTAGELQAAYEKLTRERKRLLARLERESNAKTHRERETYAQTHPHLEAHDEILERVEKAWFAKRDLKDAAREFVRVWQTENANARAAERVR